MIYRLYKKSTSNKLHYTNGNLSLSLSLYIYIYIYIYHNRAAAAIVQKSLLSKTLAEARKSSFHNAKKC